LTKRQKRPRGRGAPNDGTDHVHRMKRILMESSFSSESFQGHRALSIRRPRLNLRQLYYFVAVAEELHFGKAAERLNIAQPPLSQQISRLEIELGTKLFIRAKRAIELTTAGKRFLTDVRRILEDMESARLAAQNAGRGEHEQVILGVLPTASQHLLESIFAATRERFPAMNLLVQSRTTISQMQALNEGSADIGLVRLPTQHRALTIAPLLSEKPLVAVPRKHRLAGKEAVHLSDLVYEPHVMFSRQAAPGYYQIIQDLYRPFTSNLPIVQESEHVLTQLALVAAGCGVVLLPNSMRIYAHSGVSFVPIVGCDWTFETGIAMSRDQKRTTVLALADLISQIASRYDEERYRMSPTCAV
jgi:DNA-binding transcriptional LysR family regulator